MIKETITKKIVPKKTKKPNMKKAVQRTIQKYKVTNRKTLTPAQRQKLAGFRNVPSTHAINPMTLAQKNLYFRSLINPFDYCVKRPSYGTEETAMAHLRSFFTLQTNASGNLLVYFDPQYATAAQANTTFIYCNDVTMTNITTISGAVYKSAGTPSTPASVANMERWRLNSGALQACVKVSALNIIGSVIVAHTCVPVDVVAPSSPTVTFASLNQFTVASGLLQYAHAKEYNINNLESAYQSNWHPVDPSDSIFTNPGGYMVDNTTGDAGASPKILMYFYGLPATSNIEFRIVWNIEYVPVTTVSSLVDTEASYISSRDDMDALDYANYFKKDLVSREVSSLDNSFMSTNTSKTRKNNSNSLLSYNSRMNNPNFNPNYLTKAQLEDSGFRDGPNYRGDTFTFN
jgi:hypothetical protein